MAILVTVAAVFSLKKTNWSSLKRGLFPVFAFYICLVLGITLFCRLPFDSVKYNTQLFWSYKNAESDRNLIREIVLNYFMLLPFGVLGSLYLKKQWVMFFGSLFSISIELTQYFLRRGVFEFDDIIGNTLGIVIGIAVYGLVNKLLQNRNQ